MKIENYYFPVHRSAKTYDDAKQPHVTYEQNYKILGARLMDNNCLVYIVNDRKQFNQAQNHSTLIHHDLTTNQIVKQRKLAFTNANYEILKQVAYNDYFLISLNNDSLLFAAKNDDLIICACETSQQDQVLIALQDQLLLMDLQTFQIVQTLQIQIHYIANTSTENSVDEFHCATIVEQQCQFLRIKLKNNKLQLLEQKTCTDVKPFIGLDFFDAIQMRFSLGVWHSYGAVVLYCSQGCYLTVNALACHNAKLNTSEYVFPTVAPVVRLESSKYLISNFQEKNELFYDIVCFADAAGFLTLTIGGTEENQKRLFTVQTNMWVKNITLQFLEVEDGAENSVDMVKVNNLLEKKDKLVDVTVNRIMKIFVFGSTTLVRGEHIVQTDGFSIIYADLQQMVDLLSSEKLEVETSDNFSYANLQVQNSEQQDSIPMDQSQSDSDGNFEEEDEEEMENNDKETWDEAEVVQQPIVQQEPTFNDLFKGLVDQYQNNQLINQLVMFEDKRKKRESNKLHQQQLLQGNDVLQLQQPNINQVQTQNTNSQQSQELVQNQSQAQQSQSNELNNQTKSQDIAQSQQEVVQSQQMDQSTTQQQNKQRKRREKQQQNEYASNITENTAYTQQKTDYLNSQKQVNYQTQQNTQQQQQNLDQSAVIQQQSKNIYFQQLLQKQVNMQQIFTTQKGEQVKVTQIYQQCVLTLLSYQNIQIILEQVPLQIILDNQQNKISILLQNCVQVYDVHTQMLIYQLNVLNDEQLLTCCLHYKCKQTNMQIVDSLYQFVEISDNTAVYVVSNKRIIQMYGQYQQKYFSHSISLIDFTTVAINNFLYFNIKNKQVCVVDFNEAGRIELKVLCNLQLLQGLINNQNQLLVYLNQSVIPTELIQSSFGNFVNREVNRQIMCLIDDLEQYQQFNIIQQLIQQSIIEYQQIGSISLLQVSLLQLLQNFSSMDQNTKQLTRNYLLQLFEQVADLPQILNEINTLNIDLW